MFGNKRRTLERQLPFTEKYAVELKALNQLFTYVAIGLVCFAIGLVMGCSV